MAITTGRIANPYMDAMSAGGQLANQSMGVASQFGSNAINAFDSAGNLAFKLDSLLQEAEAQRYNQMMDIQDSLIKQFQFQQEMAFNQQQQQFKEKEHRENLAYNYENMELNRDRLAVQENYYNDSMRLRENQIVESDQNQKAKLVEIQAASKLSDLQNSFNLVGEEIKARHTKTDAFGNQHIIDQDAYNQEVLKLKKEFIEQQSFIRNELHNQLGSIYGLKQISTEQRQPSSISIPSVEEKEAQQVSASVEPVKTNSFSSALTIERGRPIIVDNLSANDRFKVQAIAKNLPLTEGSLAILDSIVDFNSLDLDQVKKYSDGLMSLKELTNFDVSKQLEVGNIASVEGFVSLGLISENKLDNNAAADVWREVFRKDRNIGDNMLSILNGMDEEKQRKIIRQINDPILNRNIKTLDEFKNNPDKFVFDESLIDKMKQTGWLKNILGFGTSDKNDADFLQSVNNIRANQLVKNNGVDVIGSSMEAFSDMASSKSGMFMESYDTQTMTYEFGKAIIEDEAISMIVSKALTGEANPNYLKEQYKQISAQKRIIDEKRFIEEVGMLGYIPKHMEGDRPADVIVYDELVKKLQSDPIVWSTINEMIYENAVDYASGANKSYFNKVSSAILGAKVASNFNTQRGNKGISSFIDSVLNQIFE